MTVKRGVQLITYPDSLGGNLGELGGLLKGELAGLFDGGIHILPPYPSSADRGFAPLTHLEIAPEFGAWDDIRAIAGMSPVMLDLIVNHISAESLPFKSFLERGRRSEYADLFIPVEKIWPSGHPPRDELAMISLRRSEPFSDFTIRETGEVVRVWTTFGRSTPAGQIDIDVTSETARGLFAETLARFRDYGVRMVRLDAVGYVAKRPGTSCFFVEPEVFHFLEWIAGLANRLGMDVLPEVHAEYGTQLRLADRGYWIYDFRLPFAILDALINQTGSRLREYLKARPRRQFTMLDCHDGVPLKPDLNGLYRGEDARRVVSVCLERGANLSLIYSPSDKDADGFDVHQIRGTYYSLLGCREDAYLAARAIQFFVPGVPQVYYVGLLAGENDVSAMERTGDGREINRHNYSVDEVRRALALPVVQRLLRLIRLRNEHEAFDGDFAVQESEDPILRLAWANGRSRCELAVDCRAAEASIRYTDPHGEFVEFPL